ncbi:DUF3231 family protein [Pseudoneobacillus sp. C159]
MDLQPMDVMKPIHLSADALNEAQPFTSIEIGKLWATYIGNSMSSQILPYFLQHCEDEYIRTLLENGIALSRDFMRKAEKLFEEVNFPIPAGFSEEDVNMGAPRLFEDQFYVHYLKYVAKAGLSLYAVAIPIVLREDVREFFVYCNQCTTILLGQINNVLYERKFIAKPPTIPTPGGPDFIKKHSFINDFVGEVRPLHALEITHLYDNIENNIASKALILAFYRTVKDEKIKALFKRGVDMTDKLVKQFMDKLQDEHLPSPSFIDHLVLPSTYPPFSDKIMLFHKVDMFSMKIRSFGNSMAVNGRRDLSLLYGKALMNVGLFVDDAANILIDKGWLESPPMANDSYH